MDFPWAKTMENTKCDFSKIVKTYWIANFPVSTADAMWCYNAL